MGHLATVQNLLHLVGGPLNLNREHSPYASEIYPFRFKLEPLTLDSLSKYVTAESPAVLPRDLSEDNKALLAQIRVDASRSNDGHEVRHVGLIFERLAQLFEDSLADDDLRLDTFARQAKFEDWGFQPGTPDAGEALIIESFPSADVAQVRAAAVAAVRKIGAQGEGFDSPPADPGNSESHFERFFDIYKRVTELASAGAVITWPVAENANTTPPPLVKPALADMVASVMEAHATKGRITHPRARAWAQLFNLRYRMLLGCFAHFMRLDHTLYTDVPGAQRGDRTAKGLLLVWTFDEMRRLSKIATKLVQLPKDDPPGPLHAGPPFELPYTVNLPEGEPQRWRTHLDISQAAVRLVREQLQPDERVADRDDFLDDLLRRDEGDQLVMQALAKGLEVPPDSVPSDFRKAVRILWRRFAGSALAARTGTSGPGEATTSSSTPPCCRTCHRWSGTRMAPSTAIRTRRPWCNGSRAPRPGTGCLDSAQPSRPSASGSSVNGSPTGARTTTHPARSVSNTSGTPRPEPLATPGTTTVNTAELRIRHQKPVPRDPRPHLDAGHLGVRPAPLRGRQGSCDRHRSQAGRRQHALRRQLAPGQHRDVPQVDRTGQATLTLVIVRNGARRRTGSLISTSRNFSTPWITSSWSRRSRRTSPPASVGWCCMRNGG